MNPNWIRTTFASLLLAVFLRVGLGVPLFSTFVALGIIYLTHVVAVEFGSAAKMVWTGFKGTVVMVVGVTIFLSLRLLAAKLLGLYPADTYNTLNDSGGFYWIFGGHDVSIRIMWEIVFAFVAGKITVNWMQGKGKKVEVIFVISLLIISFQVAFPNYSGTWWSRTELDQQLAKKGLKKTFFPEAEPDPQGTGSYTPTAPPIDALVLEHECETPCETDIAWKFQIRVLGSRALRIKFTGTGWIDYPAGEGAFRAPSMRSGKAQFASPDSTPVRVQVYRVVTVSRP